MKVKQNYLCSENDTRRFEQEIQCGSFCNSFVTLKCLRQNVNYIIFSINYKLELASATCVIVFYVCSFDDNSHYGGFSDSKGTTCNFLFVCSLPEICISCILVAEAIYLLICIILIWATKIWLQNYLLCKTPQYEYNSTLNFD